MPEESHKEDNTNPDQSDELVQPEKLHMQDPLPFREDKKEDHRLDLVPPAPRGRWDFLEQLLEVQLYMGRGSRAQRSASDTREQVE
ncbi:unnamed protein product [Caenorhabditis brenneri]